MLSIFSNSQFPDKALFKQAAVVPVYVEPGLFSGERLFAGLVIQFESEVRAVPLRALKRLRCVYGGAYRSLVLARDAALDTLREHIVKNGAQACVSWQAPAEGISVGPLLQTTAANIEEAIRTSFLQFSSLYREQDADLVEEPQVAEQRLASATGLRLEKAIVQAIAQVRPEMVKQFGLKFKIKEGARPLRLGFVGKKLVANFGLVVPTSLAAMVSNSKAKLWDLAQAREGAKDGWFSVTNAMQYELLVHHATKQDVQYSERQLSSVSEALAELEFEADKVDVRCRRILSPEAMAGHLLELEAA